MGHKKVGLGMNISSAEVNNLNKQKNGFSSFINE
jgi:hypothetical protein